MWQPHTNIGAEKSYRLPTNYRGSGFSIGHQYFSAESMEKYLLLALSHSNNKTGILFPINGANGRKKYFSIIKEGYHIWRRSVYVNILPSPPQPPPRRKEGINMQ
jgi:hypothetical protein